MLPNPTEKRNINETWRTIQRAQMLPTMRGKTTIPLTSTILVLLTKAITAFGNDTRILAHS